jgi:hypothetical protein
VDNVPQLVGLIFFVLPGYVGLWAHDQVVPAPDRTTFRATMWSLLLSAAGALLAAQVVPPAFLAHVFGGGTLSETALLGTAAQALASVAVGGGFGLVTKYVLKNRFGGRSAYPTAWDALWSEHGGERRVVVVEVADGIYSGTLAYADDPRIGRALVIKEPSRWDDAGRAFVATGAEFSYFPTEAIRRADVTKEKGKGTDGAGRTEGDDAGRDQGVAPAGREQGARRLPGADGIGGGDDAGDRRQPAADGRAGGGTPTRAR